MAVVGGETGQRERRGAARRALSHIARGEHGARNRGAQWQAHRAMYAATCVHSALICRKSASFSTAAAVLTVRRVRPVAHSRRGTQQAWFDPDAARPLQECSPARAGRATVRPLQHRPHCGLIERIADEDDLLHIDLLLRRRDPPAVAYGHVRPPPAVVKRRSEEGHRKGRHITTERHAGVNERRTEEQTENLGVCSAERAQHWNARALGTRRGGDHERKGKSSTPSACG